jgi:hypothetical protein
VGKGFCGGFPHTPFYNSFRNAIYPSPGRKSPFQIALKSVDNRSGQSLRRLRAEPLDAIGRLAGSAEPRGPTSLGEAQAAAYLDGRLRLAGLRVSADPFRASRSVGADGPLLLLPALVSVVLYYRLPLPSLFLALWGLAVAVVLLRRPGLMLLGRRRPSQNVIATRAASGRPRRRVVLLAPLDAPPVMSRLARLLADDLRPQVGRVAAYALLTLFAILAWFGPFEVRRAWWYAQFIPTIYLGLLGGLDLWLARAPISPGAVSHAGALAALLASADELANLERTELWAVAIGASASGAGLADFLRRYPFDREMTLFVGLEGVGAGNLCYVTREGLLRERPADPLLLELAAAADSADPLINAEPRPYRRELTSAARLRRTGRHALTIACLAADGETPYRGSPEDTPAVIDPQTLDRTMRLIVGLVRQIDAASLKNQERAPAGSTENREP